MDANETRSRSLTDWPPLPSSIHSLPRRRPIHWLPLGIVGMAIGSAVLLAFAIPRRVGPRYEGLTLSEWEASLPTEALSGPGSQQIFVVDPARLASNVGEWNLKVEQAVRTLVGPSDLRQLVDQLGDSDDPRFAWLVRGFRSWTARSSLLRRLQPLSVEEKRVRALYTFRLLKDKGRPVRGELNALTRSTNSQVATAARSALAYIAQ